MSTKSIPFLILGALLFAASCGSQPDSAQDSNRQAGHAVRDTFRFSGLEEVRDLFARADYTLESWQAGERSVPRYYLASVPTRWRHEVAPNLPVNKKKEYFFFVYAPLVLESNEDILADRKRLKKLTGKKKATAEETAWLRDLAKLYRLDPPEEGPVDTGMLTQLMERVDIIPPSLALAQAAVESGWSTSRFSDQGNALFGQWTWGDDGITPTEQRGQMGDYKIKAFATPEASISAYMLNLNTHPSYQGFRQERAKLRSADGKLTGSALAPTLTSYSELGEEYVETLLSVIRVNRLSPADETFLRDMQPVMLVPVGEGAE